MSPDVFLSDTLAVFHSLEEKCKTYLHFKDVDNLYLFEYMNTKIQECYICSSARVSKAVDPKMTFKVTS